MAHRHQVAQRVLGAVVGLHRELAQRALADGQQRRLRPVEEPVDRARRHETGELARARAELVAGREAQDEVQAVAHAVDEVLPQEVGRLLPHAAHHRVLLADRAHLVDRRVALVGREQPGDLTRRQERVDVLEEALVLDLVVGEDHRHGPLRRGVHVLLADRVEQLVRTEALGQLDLRVGELGDEGREARQRLLAGAADADHDEVAARQREHARHAADVLDGRVEEHEVQLLDLADRRLVVHLHECVQPLLHDLERRRRLVQLGCVLDNLAGVGVARLGAKEVDEVDGLLGRVGHVLAEELHDRVVDVGVEPLLVLALVELVGEDARAFVLPSAHDGGRVLDDVPRAAVLALVGVVVHADECEALADERQVAQVEEVVEARRRRQHLLADAAPETDRHLGELLRDRHDLRRVVGGKARLDDGAEDLLDRHGVGQRHVEHEEVALEAVGDVVLAARRVRHGRGEQQVAQALLVAGPALVERAVLHQLDHLAHQLVRHLVAPVVDVRHVDVVDEERQLTAALGAEVRAHLLDHVVKRVVEVLRRRHRREADLAEVAVLHARVGELDAPEELLQRHRLGRAGHAHQQHRLALQHRALHDVLRAHRVERRDEERGEVEAVVAGVLPLLDELVPVLPLASLDVELVVEDRRLLRRGHALAVLTDEVGVELLALGGLEHSAE